MRDTRVDVLTVVHSPDLGRMKILRDTLCPRWEAGGRHLVVADVGSYEEVRAALAGDPRSPPLDVHPIEDLLEPAALRLGGWHRQQVAKLAVADHVDRETTHYLALDADTVCLRPVRREDLFAGNGRAYIDLVKLVPPYDAWYRYTSRHIFGRDTDLPPLSVIEGAAMLFSGMVARRVQDSIERPGTASWQQVLAEASPNLATRRGRGWLDTWTEVAVYHLGALERGMLLRHHEPNLGHRPRRAGASAWTREEALRWDARRAAETGSLFAVLQGKVVPEALAAALAEPLRREISP